MRILHFFGDAYLVFYDVRLFFFDDSSFCLFVWTLFLFRLIIGIDCHLRYWKQTFHSWYFAPEIRPRPIFTWTRWWKSWQHPQLQQFVFQRHSKPQTFHPIEMSDVQTAKCFDFESNCISIVINMISISFPFHAVWPFQRKSFYLRN